MHMQPSTIFQSKWIEWFLYDWDIGVKLVNRQWSKVAPGSVLLKRCTCEKAKYLCQGIVSKKLQVWGLWLYWERDSGEVFFCEFCEIFKNTFFIENSGDCFWIVKGSPTNCTSNMKRIWVNWLTSNPTKIIKTHLWILMTTLTLNKTQID